MAGHMASGGHYVAIWSGQGYKKVTMWPFGADKVMKRSLIL